MNSVERVKAICKERKIPISKLEKDLEFANGYIGQLKKGTFPDDRLILISKYLNVSLEYLMTGKQPEPFEPKLTTKDEKDINKKVDDILSQLDNDDALMFDGEPMDEETKELLRASLENGVRMAKIMAKKKFTPQKYRK